MRYFIGSMIAGHIAILAELKIPTTLGPGERYDALVGTTTEKINAIFNDTPLGVYYARAYYKLPEPLPRPRREQRQ